MVHLHRQECKDDRVGLASSCHQFFADSPRSITNPSTGEKLTDIPEGMSADVDRAVKAAHEAFKTTWGYNTPGFKRGEVLIRVAELIERDLDILASLEALDNGKAFSVAKAFDVSFFPS